MIEKSDSYYIRCTYSFDEEGRPTGQTNYDAAGNVLDKSTVEYRNDSNGNWAEKKSIMWDTKSEPRQPQMIGINYMLRRLPRNGGSVRLLICPYCNIPRRGLYGWELGGHFTSTVTRSTWGCRKCNLLRYASEGEALLIRPRGTLGVVFGTGHSPRPESWLPYVFTSTEEAVEAGVL